MLATSRPGEFATATTSDSATHIDILTDSSLDPKLIEH